MEEDGRAMRGNGTSGAALFPPPQLPHIRPGNEGNEAENCCESLRPFPSAVPSLAMLPPRCHRAAVRPRERGWAALTRSHSSHQDGHPDSKHCTLSLQ